MCSAYGLSSRPPRIELRPRTAAMRSCARMMEGKLRRHSAELIQERSSAYDDKKGIIYGARDGKYGFNVPIAPRITNAAALALQPRAAGVLPCRPVGDRQYHSLPQTFGPLCVMATLVWGLGCPIGGWVPGLPRGHG